MSRTKRIAVVGSGFGGLTVAIRLQTAGFDTVLFEARDKPGGRAYVYEQDGFVFDGGPTVITAPNLFDELFAEADRDVSDYVELLPVDPFYRLEWEDGTRFDYNGDFEAMSAQIGCLEPSDVDGYRAFVEYARKVFAAGYTDLAATPFLRFSDMVRVAPGARQAAGRPLRVPCREPLRERRARAPGAQLPLSPGRRKPLRDQLDLHAHPPPGARVGRLLPEGGHGRAGRGPGPPVRGARWRAAAQHAGRSHPRRGERSTTHP